MKPKAKIKIEEPECRPVLQKPQYYSPDKYELQRHSETIRKCNSEAKLFGLKRTLIGKIKT